MSVRMRQEVSLVIYRVIARQTRITAVRLSPGFAGTYIRTLSLPAFIPITTTTFLLMTRDVEHSTDLWAPWTYTVHSSY